MEVKRIGKCYEKKEEGTMNDACKECPDAYELTDKQKENFDGSIGCESIEKYGYCRYAKEEEMND